MTKHDPADIFKRARSIAEDALALPEEERGAFIASSCGEDDALRSQVDELLSNAKTSDSFLAETIRSETRDPAQGAMPKQIGRYAIRRVISTGGMGTVYEALQQNPRRRVAIKVIKAGLASSSALKRFEYESQVLGRLNHPAIAEIYEAGTFDDGTGEAPFFAMEYIEGAKPLVEWAQKKHLSTREKLKLFAQVCDAIHHGHQKGVVHRDLKPDNILIDTEGRPRVIDFGVARATDSDMQIATMQTDVGQLVGTLYYMSPEQCEADPDLIDTRSDVYALGVILFELLTGRRPHQLDNVPVYDAARIIREEAPSKMSTLDRTLGGDLDTIVGKALEKDKDRRYQSALELKQDIERFLSNEAIEARPPSLLYQTQVFARRNKALVTSLAVIFIVLAGTTVWSLIERSRADSERSRAEDAATSALASKQAAEEALAEAEVARNRASDEAQRAFLIIKFLSSTLEMANPEYAQGRQMTLPDLLKEASDSIGKDFTDEPIMEANLRRTLGRIQLELAEIESADTNLMRALILAERHLPRGDALRVELTLLIARTRQEQGRYDEVRSRLESIELAIEDESDRDEPLMIEAVVLRGDLAMEELDIASALASYTDAVERARRVLGPDDPKTIEYEVALASGEVIQALLGGEVQTGGAALSIDYAFGDVDRVEEALGALHPVTLSARMADVLTESRTGSPETLKKLELLVDDYDRVFGESHPDSLEIRSLYGFLVMGSGKFEEAASIMWGVYDGFVEKYGPAHPTTLSVASTLGNVLLGVDRAEEAVPLLHAAWDGQRRIWGENDVRTTQAEAVYAIALMMINEFEKADPRFEHSIEGIKALPMSLAGSGYFNQFLVKIMQLLEFEHRAEALAEAERLTRVIFETEDADPKLRGNFLLVLCNLLFENDAREEAAEVGNALIELAPTLFEDQPKLHADGLHYLTRTYSKFDEMELALEMSDMILALLAADDSIEGGLRTNAPCLRGTILVSLDRPEEAIPYFETTIERLKESMGPDAMVTLRWQAELFVAYARAGQNETARTYGRAMLIKALGVMAPDDPRLTEAFPLLLKGFAEHDPEEAIAFFDEVLLACGEEPIARAAAINQVLRSARDADSEDLKLLLYPHVQEACDELLANHATLPEVARLGMVLLMVGIDIEHEEPTFDGRIAGERLVTESMRLLDGLDGAVDEREWLYLTTEFVEETAVELLGEDDPLVRELHAHVLAAQGLMGAAIEAYRTAAITADDQDARRRLLDKADALRTRVEQEKALAAEGDEGEDA